MAFRASVAFLASLVGCGPPSRTDVSSTDAAADAGPPLPEGAWEPDPGMARTSALLVGDGADIWFVYARAGEMAASEVWMTKTTASGTVLVPPVRVDSGPETAAWPASAARSQQNLAVTYKHSAGTLPPRLRMFDAAGTPARAMAHLVPLGTVAGTYVTATALTARADGTMRLFAAHDHDMAADEVVMVELDGNGDPAGQPTLIGTADVGVPSHLAASFAPDGTTHVAWDRVYDICQGHTDPDATVATRVGSGGTPSTLTDIQPLEPSDREPSVATLGDTGYIAWTSETSEGTDIRMARADAPNSVVAIMGNPAFGNHAPVVTLSEQGRGAIAWMTYEPAIRVAAFHEENGSVVVSSPHVFAPLADGLFTLRGIVPIEGDRFVVGWTEDSFTASRARLYAVELDLSLPPKPWASEVTPSWTPPRERVRRCSH